MKILYLAHRIPYPPNKGEKIRSLYQIQHLAKKHEVHLACLVDERGDLQYVEKLRKYCASVDAVYRGKTAMRVSAAIALLSPQPLSVASFFSRQLRKAIDRKLEAEKFDRIFVSSSSMAKYVWHVQRIPKVIDFIDVDSEKWKLYADSYSFPFSLVYRLEARRLARYEEEIARTFEHSIFISQEEQLLFQQRVSDRPVSVVSNGVDLEYFAPVQDGSSNLIEPVAVFIGGMDYFPNVDAVQFFCKDIFPLVREAVPEAKFCIVGRNPTRQVRALGCIPHVIVTGSVPDVRPYLAKAAVAVAPFRIARGVQNKVLEAMAMGVPVVGTAQVFRGIPATVENGVRIADEPRSFAGEVIRFLKERGRLRQWHGLQARCYVESHHQWQHLGAELERLLGKVSRTSSALSVLPSLKVPGV